MIQVTASIGAQGTVQKLQVPDLAAAHVLSAWWQVLLLCALDTSSSLPVTAQMTVAARLIGPSESR